VEDSGYSRQKEAPKPNYRLRGILFIPMAVAGIFFSLFTLNVTSYFEVMIYGILPVGLLWMCFMGVSINRYQQSLNDVLIWNEEKEITKSTGRDGVDGNWPLSAMSFLHQSRKAWVHC
jgi:hypothetical protein